MAPKLKLDQQSEMQVKLSELDKLQKSNIESMVQKATSDLRKKFEQDRENCLKTQQQQLTMKAKRDIDALRKRFKMMQTTGALERSPSCSESELSAEVICFVIILKVKIFQKVYLSYIVSLLPNKGRKIELEITVPIFSIRLKSKRSVIFVGTKMKKKLLKFNYLYH